MTLTLLIVAGIAITLTAAYIFSTRPAEVLASETTLAEADAAAAAETLSGQQFTPATGSEWRLTTVDALSDAEDLLDLLENQGVAERELVVLGNSSFVVRWR